MPEKVYSENQHIRNGERAPFINREVILLYSDDLTASELNVIKIVKFMGGTVKQVRLTQEVLANEESLKRSISSGICLVTSAQTLSNVINRREGNSWVLRLLIITAKKVLVYGFKPNPHHDLLLQELTSGGLLGVKSPSSVDSNFKVDNHSQKICRQFTGLSFGTADPETDLSFIEETKKSNYSSLIQIGKDPFFVSVKVEGCQLLLLACRRIADLDEVLLNDTSILTFFSGLVPLMMFIYNASSNAFWHNDTPTACFIIDDPLLINRYGFLDYRALLEVMQRQSFCTSIAFIPWNYRRSRRSVAAMLAEHLDRYSLCIHGYDHTRTEFGSSIYLLLKDKAKKALDYMMLHQQFTGIPFDKIMVFPQGVFSTVAIKALKSCGYIAAVNSTPHPIDINEALTLRERLDIAVMRFSNFPIFIRRYPKNVAEIAFDLFLGKPALIVEHHDYFRSGYGALAEFIEKSNALDNKLKWASLSEICLHSCLKRMAENGDIHIRFFTDRFILQNDTEQSQNYVLFRQNLPEELPASVTVNGRYTEFSKEANYLKINHTLLAEQTAEIIIQYANNDSDYTPIRQNLINDVKVCIRRRLSEIRDNYVEKNKYFYITASLIRDLYTRIKKEKGK